MDLVPATVTQVSPLLVTLDGATQPTSAIKISVFVATLNMRVMTVRQGTALYVVGPIG